MGKKIVVGVIGGRNCDKEVEKLAYDLGRELTKAAQVLVTGGLGGVMQAASRGFKDAGGLTLGIIPGYNKDDANPFVDIVIPTGIGLARNVIVVKSASVVIALAGSAGTLSEIAYCLQFGIPVISLNSWDIKGVIRAGGVEEAVNEVKKITAGVGDTACGF